MSGNNTYKRINDHEIEINGVIYTDGGTETLYPTGESTPTGGSDSGGSSGSSYVYVPGSAAPTDGDPLSYAGWLQGSTKYQAEQDRIKIEQQAQADRQRQIVDANSAYMQGQALYGANAERMASMGLTNSGYGEYLTGKAYATQRGEVQNANRTAQARIDQAIYEEGRIKQQADAKYAKDLIGIQNQQNEDYTSLYDSALNGASIESIMQDSRWGGLSPERQATIKSVTTANSIKIRIDNGESLETIIADPASGWNDLTVDQQNTLNTYSTSKTEAKKAENDEAYTKLLGLIGQGTPMADLVNTSDYEKLDNTSKANLHYKDMLNQVNKGVTYEELEKSTYFNLLGEKQQEIKKAADDYAEYEKRTVTAEVGEALGNANILTKDQLIEDLMQDYTDMSFVNKVVDGWQKKNLESMQNEKNLTQTMIDQAVAKGRITEDQAKKLTPKQAETPPSDTPSATLSKGENNQKGKPIQDQSTINALNAKGKAKFGDVRTHNGKTYLYNNGWYDVTGTPFEKMPKDGTDIEDPASFIENNVKIGTATTKGGEWHVNNLRQGFEGEDIELIIGSANGTTGRRFDAKIGAKEAAETTVKALNKLATGSETGTPSVDYERAFNISGANNTDSKNKPGKIVAYNGVLYIYTRRLGWARLEGKKGSDTAAMTAEFIKNAS